MLFLVVKKVSRFFTASVKNCRCAILKPKYERTYSLKTLISTCIIFFLNFFVGTGRYAILPVLTSQGAVTILKKTSISTKACKQAIE